MFNIYIYFRMKNGNLLGLMSKNRWLIFMEFTNTVEIKQE